MKLKHFINIKTLEELKNAYRKLAMQHHPDKGGKLETMQEINCEYEYLFDKLPKTQQNADNNNNNTTQEFASDFIEIIDRLINCIGLNIEICGTWIWLSGNTYDYRDLIKSLGFKWRSKKQMWSLGEFGNNRHKEWSIDKIRNTYGSNTVKSNNPVFLT